MDMAAGLQLQTRVEEVPPWHVLSLRHRGAYPQIGRTFGELMGHLSRLHLPPNTCMAVYYDDPATTEESELTSDACVIFDGDVPEHVEPLIEKTIDGGRYLVGRYQGSYLGLGEAWQWMFEQGLKFTGCTMDMRLPYEVYVLHDEQDPGKCVTDIYVPVK